jgi:hypothetical protein
MGAFFKVLRAGIIYAGPGNLWGDIFFLIWPVEAAIGRKLDSQKAIGNSYGNGNYRPSPKREELSF